jgi:hypothetical protein
MARFTSKRSPFQSKLAPLEHLTTPEDGGCELSFALCALLNGIVRTLIVALVAVRNDGCPSELANRSFLMRLLLIG